MVERTPEHLSRPRPGPRPKTAAHGTTRRRVASRTQPVAERSARRATGGGSPTRSRHPPRPERAKRAPMSRSAKVRWWLAVAVVTATAFAVALLEAPFFSASHVQISGAARTSEGAILDALAIDADQALITYDIDGARAEVSDLPWVEKVTVTRQWPSTVRVVLRERTVAAAVGRPTGSQWAVIGSDGVVVEYRMTPPVGVPIIVTTNEVLDSSSIGQVISGVERALEISRDLPLQLEPWVTTWRSDGDGVVAELVGSARADFGKMDDHRTQFVSLASILNGGADLVCLETINLSIADTPVLERDDVCMNASRALG